MAESDSPQPSTSSSDRSPENSIRQQNPIAALGGLKMPNGNIPTFPIMYPALLPGIIPLQQDQELMNRGPGLYAVPILPYMQQIPGFAPNNLIPFTYNIPTERSTPENGEVGNEQGRPGEQPHQQQLGPEIVRRFQIAIQIDLLLILKLVALIFLFNHDGSRQRFILLMFFAVVVYLYQTGTLSPVVKWLSQGMRRAAQRPRPGARPDNLPAAPWVQDQNVGIQDGQQGGENENREMNEGDRVDANEDGQGQDRNRWWGIVNEIQLIVFGFITSLLPGFHNID